jgi:hypothetical protein
MQEEVHMTMLQPSPESENSFEARVMANLSADADADARADAEERVLQQMEEEAISMPFGDDGAYAVVWQKRDGWYWTIVSPNSLSYSEDHGPYPSRYAALGAVLAEARRDAVAAHRGDYD